MLKQRPMQHKRKKSQIDLFYPSKMQPNTNNSTHSLQGKKQTHSKGKIKKNIPSHYNQKDKFTPQKLKLTIPSCQTDKNNGKNILKLLQNSQRRVHKKQTVIQDIDDHHGDENVDTSNGACYSNNSSDSQQGDQNDPYFLFGRKERNPSLQKQNYQTNYNWLNMEEITQVPDTMSNSRRYDGSNFYQFNTSNKNSLANFSNKFIDHQAQEQKIQNPVIQKKLENNNSQKPEEENKNLKHRKQKGPKNIVIDEGYLVNPVSNQCDLSELMVDNKKPKILFLNKKENKKSKSRQIIKKVEKEKSRSSLLSSKKSKSVSTATLFKKKSLSLKNEAKLVVKPLQKKAKSFQKSKQYSAQNKSSGNYPNKVIKSARISQQMNYSKTSNLQLGEKITMIEQSQSKLQNQYKVLWECVGQLWQNSRITRYISQRNKSDILKLKDIQKHQDQKMIKLKSQIIHSISSARY